MRNLLLLLLVLSINCGLFAQQSNDKNDLYDIQDKILIKTSDGEFVSAIVVTKKGTVLPLPVIFQFSIYPNYKRDVENLKKLAERGYVGVIAYTRGKYLSPSEIVPYEHDGKDAHEVIDWISKQTWCNGKVGMFGGSYNGFTQWAAAKYAHPALKTIVPSAASIPGMGLPMENSIFINPNYQWAFYVTNNKTLDNAVNNDRERFRQMENKWWRSGVAYRKIDSIDGTPNKWLQRWLQHPSYDTYWQNMVPYEEEYSKIKIPVLVADGYYNDSQISSLFYFREHAKYNKNARQYLIIGPYGHFGAQIGGTPEINEYKVDPVAIYGLKNVRYQWFDHILKGGKKPEFLKDKINYQVMGTNKWKHASSLDKINNAELTFHLSNKPIRNNYLLAKNKPSKLRFIPQEVDYKDRQTANDGFYPYPIIKEELNRDNGVSFISKPFKKAIEISGSFEGEIKTSISKKDMDISIALYELMPNGKYFQLSYFVGRASYAKNKEKRNLLKPNTIETIPQTKNE